MCVMRRVFRKLSDCIWICADLVAAQRKEKITPRRITRFSLSVFLLPLSFNVCFRRVSGGSPGCNFAGARFPVFPGWVFETFGRESRADRLSGPRRRFRVPVWSKDPVKLSKKNQKLPSFGKQTCLKGLLCRQEVKVCQPRSELGQK